MQGIAVKSLVHNYPFNYAGTFPYKVRDITFLPARLGSNAPRKELSSKNIDHDNCLHRARNITLTIDSPKIVLAGICSAHSSAVYGGYFAHSFFDTCIFK